MVSPLAAALRGRNQPQDDIPIELHAADADIERDQACEREQEPIEDRRVLSRVVRGG